MIQKTIDKKMVDRYQLIPRTLVFIEHNEKYVFIEKDFKDSFFSGSINGIGGHMEKGEDPYSAVRREVLEETGLELTKLELVALLINNTGVNPGILVFLFLAESNGGEIKESPEGKIITLSRNEIDKKEGLFEDIPLLIELCESHINNTKPSILMYQRNKNEKMRIVVMSD